MFPEDVRMDRVMGFLKKPALAQKCSGRRCGKCDASTATSMIVLLWLAHTMSGVVGGGTKDAFETWIDEKKTGSDMSPIERMMVHHAPNRGTASWRPDPDAEAVADARADFGAPETEASAILDLHPRG